MTTYETFETSYGDTQIRRIEADGKIWVIPSDPDNSDYQRYLKWLEDPTATEPIGGNK